MQVLRQPMHRYLTLLQEIVVLYGALNGHFETFGINLFGVYCYKKLITTILAEGNTAWFNTTVLNTIVYNTNDNFTFNMFKVEADFFLKYNRLFTKKRFTDKLLCILSLNSFLTKFTNK